MHSREQARTTPSLDARSHFRCHKDSQPIYIQRLRSSFGGRRILGLREIKPRLVHKMMSDQWYTLESRDDQEGMEGHRGEIRVQILLRTHAAEEAHTTRFRVPQAHWTRHLWSCLPGAKEGHQRIYAMKVLSKREIALKKEVTHTMGERKILEKSLDCPFLVGLKFSFRALPSFTLSPTTSLVVSSSGTCSEKAVSLKSVHASTLRTSPCARALAQVRLSST